LLQAIELFGEPAGTRTQDHLIKSCVALVGAGFRLFPLVILDRDIILILQMFDPASGRFKPLFVSVSIPRNLVTRW
jgi:hypothetical protein